MCLDAVAISNAVSENNKLLIIMADKQTNNWFLCFSTHAQLT